MADSTHTSSRLQNNARSGESGAVMLLVVIIMMAAMLTAALAFSGIMYKEYSAINRAVASAKSRVAADSLAEDIVLRLTNGREVDLVETLSIGGAEVSATVTDTADGKLIEAVGDVNDYNRRLEIELEAGEGAAFFYGIQVGLGGFIIQNSASVVGNIYANGTVVGEDNLVVGDVVSAGPGGRISGIRTDYSAYAHYIENSDIGGNAYYTTIFNTTVDGTKYPGSPDQEPLPLPIQDEKIEEWEAQAEAGGVYTGSCPYQINSDTTLGPIKIPCDLEIKGNGIVVTLAGPVWVVGDITLSNQPTVKIDSSLSGKSVPVIADDPSDRLSSSRIQLNNGDNSADEFIGADEDSYILLISQNASAENGGGTKAIEVQNSISGDFLVYAGHGEILIQNSADLKEVTAYRIRLQNSAVVRYESGLANLVFTTGPSGGYVISSYQEVYE